jgi:hypothetical protein
MRNNVNLAIEIYGVMQKHRATPEAGVNAMIQALVPAMVLAGCDKQQVLEAIAVHWDDIVKRVELMKAAGIEL